MPLVLTIIVSPCVYLQNGQTALMKSSFRGRLEVVEELVRRGALIDLKCRVNTLGYNKNSNLEQKKAPLVQRLE